MKKIILSILIATLFLSGCSIFKLSSRIYNNYDPVHHATRYHVDFLFLRSVEWRTPMNLLSKSFLKLSDKNSNKVSYTIYDQLNLKVSSGQIKDTVFIMVDGQIFPKKMESLALINRSGVNTSTEQVMTADSTMVDIVSGVESHTWKEASFHYNLSSLLAEKMKQAADIRFIYYVGPHIITVKLSRTQLNRLRKLFEMRPAHSL